MRFTKVYGNFTKEEVTKAEEIFSAVCAELATNSSVRVLGSRLGGDPLVFSLIFPYEHHCTDHIGHQRLRTAATDGRKFYWNAKFINKLDKVGLRIVMQHEAWHAIFMHPQRRGSRLPLLWNIAVDYKVNYTILTDLKSRDVSNPDEMFKKSLGEAITLQEYADYIKDPFNPPARLAHLKPSLDRARNTKSNIDPKDIGRPKEEPKIDTEGKTAKEIYEEQERLDEEMAKKYPPMFFADSNIPKELMTPEKIYDFLYSHLPKCPACGKIGLYKFPDNGKGKDKSKSKDKNGKDKGDKSKDEKSKDKQKGKGKKDQEGQDGDQHDHGENGQECDHGRSGHGQQPGQGQGNSPGQGQPDQSPGQGEGECDHDSGCGTCGDGFTFDPFGVGDLIDVHIDIDGDITPEEVAKRIADAIYSAKKMAGTIPGDLSDELEGLLAPKMTWQDFVRQIFRRRREGKGKSDWTRPRARPLLAGIYAPKTINYHVKCLVFGDCSGSMSNDDIAFGLSQLRALDNQAELFLVAFDTKIYWDKMVNIKSAKTEELMKFKVHGRGGTMVGDAFREYRDHVKDIDMLIFITDGYLADTELENTPKPDCPVLWVVTSNNTSFNPKYGRVYNLHNS